MIARGRKPQQVLGCQHGLEDVLRVSAGDCSKSGRTTPTAESTVWGGANTRLISNQAFVVPACKAMLMIPKPG